MESFTISKVFSLQEFYNINSVLQPMQFVSYMYALKKNYTFRELPGYITILNSSNFLSKSISHSTKGVIRDRGRGYYT